MVVTPEQIDRISRQLRHEDLQNTLDSRIVTDLARLQGNAGQPWFVTMAQYRALEYARDNWLSPCEHHGFDYAGNRCRLWQSV